MAVGVDLHGLAAAPVGGIQASRHTLYRDAVHLAAGAQPAQAELLAETVAFTAAAVMTAAAYRREVALGAAGEQRAAAPGELEAQGEIGCAGVETISHLVAHP